MPETTLDVPVADGPLPADRLVVMTWWHCGSCGWSVPSWGEPPECEMCGEEDMTPECEGQTDAE